MVGSYFPSGNSAVLPQRQDTGQNVPPGAGSLTWAGPWLDLGCGHLLVQQGAVKAGK